MKLTMWRLLVVLSTYTKFWWKIVFAFPSIDYHSKGNAKTIFPKTFLFVLRTTRTRHMVSFINF